MYLKNYILHHLPAFTLGIFLLLCKNGINVNAQVNILVNKGSFASIEEAAISEEKVNWSDADLTDDRACTECFAAVELAHFLPLCTSTSEKDILLNTPDKLPGSGNVFLLGSRESNPLISRQKLPEAVEFKSDQSFRIYAFRENNRTITVIEGKDRAGTLYGVYAYLNELVLLSMGLENKEQFTLPGLPICRKI